MNWKRRFTALAVGLCLTVGILPSASALTVYGYREGYAQASEGDKWGFVDSTGAISVPLQYRSVVSFTLGVAAVNLNGRLGVIRPDGTYLIRPEYDSLLPVGCGLYIAQKGADWGVVSILTYIDGNGVESNEIYPLAYRQVELGTSGGVDALILISREGQRTVVPLFQLPGILEELGVPGSQFPLTRGKVPAFNDVKGKDWYSLWVDIAYNVGIMAGTGDNIFAPQREVTVAEALQMAANMDSRYRGDSFHTTTYQASPWYMPAVDYCRASGIMGDGEFDNYERAVTRRELARIFASTSLAKSLPRRNDLAKVAAAVKDVSPLDPAVSSIYSLYTKGILTGVDGNLSFRPDNNVTRAEAAALAARLARPEQRVDLW